MAEDRPPPPSSQPLEGKAREDSTITSEVQRINRILEIENMDWTSQLKQAVSAHFTRFDPVSPCFA